MTEEQRINLAMDSMDFQIKVLQKIVVHGALEENEFEIKMSKLKSWLMGIGTHWTYNDIHEDIENGKLVCIQGFSYGGIPRFFFLKRMQDENGKHFGEKQ